MPAKTVLRPKKEAIIVRVAPRMKLALEKKAISLEMSVSEYVRKLIEKDL